MIRATMAQLLLAAATFGLLLASCGDPAPMSVRIEPDEGIAELDDLTRLEYRVFAVEDVDETLATATNPNGSPVQAVSCAVLSTAAPEATDCTETERRVTRDRELLASGTVPADGIVSFQGGQRVRVYASLRADELRIDELGRVCSWNGNDVIEANVADASVGVSAFC